MCDDLKLQDFATTDGKGNLNCWIYGFEEYVTDPKEDQDTPAEKA